MNKFQRYLVGTLFDEQEQEKKTSLHNMKAKDPMGNTRWKGAFTGGFQAGYKNTCGSKDGWAPATFVSSVYNRADNNNNQRSIFDYMDKEDLGREAVGQNIVVNQSFKFSPNNLNITIQQTIGQQILNKLKKIQAHLSAPESEQQMHKLFQLYSKEDQHIRPNYDLKDLPQPLSVGSNHHQIQQDDFVDSYQDFYRKVIREHAKEETEEQIKKRREENRIYFDFTRPLQEQPQYLKEIHEVNEYQQPRKRKKNLINELSLKSIYEPSQVFQQFAPSQDIEKAPEDYDPYARMRGRQQIGTPKPVQQHNRPLNSDKRSQMLGQVKLSSKFVSSQNSLANKFMTNQKKVQQMVKFFEQEKKNKRFQEYIEQMQGKKISSQLESLTYEQAEKERVQFQEKFKEYEQMKKKQQQKSCEQEEKGVARKGQVMTFHIERRVESWRPQKLLCKRFNVLTPYTIHSGKSRYQEQQY